MIDDSYSKSERFIDTSRLRYQKYFGHSSYTSKWSETARNLGRDTCTMRCETGSIGLN